MSAETPVFTVLRTAEYLREEAARRLESRLLGLPHAGEEITCRAGCSACCRQLVVISPLEALALAEYVGTRPELREAVSARLEAWRDRVAAHPDLSEALRQFEAAAGCLPDAEGAALEEAYWAAQIPCPFLEGDLCSVYPTRPFACREHLVTSDPSLCAASLDAPVSAGVRLEFRAVAEAVGASCHGLAERSILLSRALEYAASLAPPPDSPSEEVRSAAEDAQRRVRMALARLLLAGNQ